MKTMSKRIGNTMNFSFYEVFVCTCNIFFWVFFLPCCFGRPDGSDLRQLMQNYEENQDLISNLGTHNFEIVYPVQYRQDWVRGLSTKEVAPGDKVLHLPKTSMVIKTLQHKFQLELELNINLLAPTLVQTLNFKSNQQILEKEIENCYYHGTVQNYTNAYAALRTCYGLSGVIYFEKEVFLIHPLFGDDSINHPHLLYRYFNDDDWRFSCENQDENAKYHCLQSILQQLETEIEQTGNKYIELALFLDNAFFEKHVSSGKDAIAEAIQIVNCADLLFQSLNTRISIVYIELWAENQIDIDDNTTTSLTNFQEYVSQKMVRLSADASQLLTDHNFKGGKTGNAFVDSICTTNAVGIAKTNNIFKPHLSAWSVAHMLGHNLGMYHDHACCQCPLEGGCLMYSSFQNIPNLFFSSCSIEDFQRLLHKGFGECLYNMPKMRESICGNGILEKEEECDCGASEECLKFGSCCDPITCKYIKHAECSSGPCCKKCKLLSTDYMCRSSVGECDIPEFCDGYNGECPKDLYKKNGVVCNDGLGYCYLGHCPSIKQQCENLWGYGSDTANTICYERFNVRGTPNGNCGTDSKGSLAQCSLENVYCGTLQCHNGKRYPILTQKPIEFLINKINSGGTVHECKVIPSLGREPDHGLVIDGTKCGYQKFCVNTSCIKIQNKISGNCPVTGSQHLVCSGHGVCTNINSCYCDEGWTGYDCGESEMEEFMEAKDELSEIKKYPVLAVGRKMDDDVENLQPAVKESLVITIVITCVLIGLALVVLVLLILFKGKRIFRRSDKYPSFH